MKKLLGTALAVAASVSLAAVPANAGGPNYNSETYWESQLRLDCVKYDDLDTPYWTATVDGVVVVKGGSVDYGWGPGIDVVEVMAGEVVYAPLNNGGQQAAVSWIIECENDYPYYP